MSIRSRRLLATILFPLGALLATTSDATAQTDSVYALSARTGRRSVLTGLVKESGLAEVVVDRDGKESRVDSAEVESITWGGLSAAFREADVYFDRGDFENAAAKYRLATDVEERDVLKAVARARTGEALMKLGASNPAKLTEALEEFDRFIADYPDNRALPEVRWMKARSALLSGDAATAGATFGALYNEGAGSSPTPGYDPMLCARAGVAGANAVLAAGDTLAARDMFGGVRSRLSSMRSKLEADDPAAVELARLEAEADLGEGFVLIAKDQGAQAKTFFNARLSDKNSSPTTLYGATLGLAEAHLTSLEYSQARLKFAEVAALDFTNRDRVARANLGQARCRMNLKDGEWKAAVRTGLEAILATYGNTPSANEARSMLSAL